MARLMALWRQAGLSPDLYRSFSHAIFALRAEMDPPFAIFFSLADRDFCVALFRHAPFLREDAAELPGLRGKLLLDWPIRDHARTVPVPHVRCQRHGCAQVGGAPADPRLLDTFERHRSHDDGGVSAAITRELRAVWQDQMEPAIARDVAAALSARQLAADSAGMGFLKPVIQKNAL